MKERKFKVGDTVRITGCTYAHGFNIGEEVKITVVNTYGYDTFNGSESWVIDDSEVELVANKFTADAAMAELSSYRDELIENVSDSRIDINLLMAKAKELFVKMEG